MVNKSFVVGVRLPPKIREILKKLADSQEMSESEYMRNLLYKELERLSILTTNLAKAKEEIFKEVG
jgi:predicted DNA-binding protein